MIGVWPKPLSSSASRMAATRPSIMSDGATISAPASAWDTAVRARSGRVASLSTCDSGSLPPRAAPAPAAPRLRPPPVLRRRQPEQQHRRNAQRAQLLRLPWKLVERELVLARHRLDLAPDAIAVRDEQRVHEVLRRVPVRAPHP